MNGNESQPGLTEQPTSDVIPGTLLKPSDASSGGRRLRITTGLLRDLNVTCILALPLPSRFRDFGEVIQNGQSAGLARGSSITSLDGRTLFATCDHHVGGAPI